jgi:hypothetical protein
MHQWTLLREQGIPNPNPIEEFYKDLKQQLHKWKQQTYEIILMIDANENIGSKTSGLTEIVVQLNMADMITLHHGTDNEPNTHLRGSKRIDYILGTQRVQECCSFSGILPFHNGYASDHRPIYASINMDKLMSDSITTLDSQAIRLISKATPRERLQLIHLVDEHYQAHNIYQRLNDLDQISEESWQPENQEEYEACDTQHITGLVAAEKKVCRPKLYPWSPSFRDAANLKAIWSIMLSRARTNTPLSTSTKKWIQDTLHRDLTEPPSIDECKAELRKAQQQLKNVKKRAHELRIEFLLQALDEATAASEEAREKAIRHITRSQEKLQSFARIRQIFKPMNQSGLSRILIPASATDGNEWEAVTHPDQIQEKLRQHNIQHFGMAHGTPFTCAPLTCLNWEADSPEAEQLLRGELPCPLVGLENKHLEKMIHHIRDMPQLPEIECQLTAAEVARGFRKWREATSTSPSGCHLGLRRVTTYRYNDEETEKIKGHILQVQTQIINLPLKHGFSPRRWQDVVSAMIEKIPNYPYIHKLRVIHLLEADYNLCLKAIFGRKLTWNCEEHNALGEVQNGFRPG